MESVGHIIERVCPCGGDPTGPMHQESLLHRQWLLGKGLRNREPLAQPDRRHLSERIVQPDTSGYHIPGSSPQRLR